MVPDHRSRGGSGRSRSHRGGELVGPRFFHAKRKRIGQEALEFLGRQRRRFLRGELVALGDTEIKPQPGDAVEPIGSYAVLLRFDDGHATGIFSWDVLHELGRDYARNWQAYLDAMAEAGLERAK